MKFVTADEMKAIEARGVEFGASMTNFMLNAGEGVFNAITTTPGFDPHDNNNRLNGGLVLILAGPGNNGGDAMVVSALLKQAYPEAEVKIYFHKRSRPEDPQGFDTRLTYTDAEEQEGHDLSYPASFAAFEEDLYEATLIVDGILGVGGARPTIGETARIIETVNQVTFTRRHEPQAPFVVAIDIPSGLNAETGEPNGAALKANLTVCLGYPKYGLFTYNALEYTGKVTLADFGLPSEIHKEIAATATKSLITAEFVRANLPPRPLNGHKGTFGKLLVVSGAPEYLGAPYLCTSASMRSGAGLVTLAAPPSIIPVMASKMSENTFLPVPEADPTEILNRLAEKLPDYQAMLFGPGLGQAAERKELTVRLMALGDRLPPMVLDADGLNMLAQIPQWWQSIPPNNILTPHPAELARLTQSTVLEIERDRLKAATDAAQKFKQIIILKGAYTIVAAPDGRVRVNPAANPALATAGSGDVLAGICAGILVQAARAGKYDPFDIACLGVYLHGMAGELLRREFGDTGVLAGDLLPAIPQAINAIKTGDGLE